MIALPLELIEQIKFHCNNNNLGMSAISSNELYVIVVGNNKISPNYIHLMVAHMMITGVLSGDLENANDKAEEKQEKEEKERKPF